MENIILGIVFLALMLLCGIISIFQFMQKCVLLNNEYFYAADEERKSMNKKPHYIQTGIVFALLSTMFLSFGLKFLFDASWLYAIAVILLLAAAVFAVVSSIKLRK